PLTAAHRQDRPENSHRHEQLGAAYQARDRLDMHGMPGENQTRCRCAQWRKPASEQRNEQHSCQPVPERVHDMQPTRPATEQRPVERVAQDRDRPVESGAGLARPVRVVEGREPGAGRMRGGRCAGARTVLLIAPAVTSTTSASANLWRGSRSSAAPAASARPTDGRYSSRSAITTPWGTIRFEIGRYAIAIQPSPYASTGQARRQANAN